ncbi:MAG: DUF2330 domain-containing protein [Myxococcales bacterium]|nr:DUF2330 domain-containing protein [Myxococcales bacterium]
MKRSATNRPATNRPATNRPAALALALTLTTPAAAFACGGLFCNNSQPVNQAAERILFAREGDTMHMHVRITYQGPPTEFGWLLPTATDVRVEQSSEQLFTTLDQSFAPRFALQTVFDARCAFANRGGFPPSAADDGGEGEGEGEGEGGVQVLSREAVGPFDIATLLPETVDDLRTWLDGNGYQIPTETDATLQPYVAAGLAFVAVKLLPDRESGDISPLHLAFTADRPAIPIVPTSVAADPDMGIIVHVLGAHRAVPVNYRHVVINEAAIDWPGGGQNYPDVVSQAADEAGGQAFTTDYAGPASGAPQPYSDAILQAVRDAQSGETLIDALGLFDLFFQPLDADLQRVLPTGLLLPEDIALVDYLNCPGCYDDRGIEVDGAALADRIETEVNEPRRHLGELFEAHPYLTRLYGTMSPAEMVLDPEFDENPDLADVANQRTAIQTISCDGGGTPLFGSAVVETPSGLRFRLVDGQNPNAVRRQDGQTVRGGELPSAQVIERALTAGQSEVVEDRTAEIDDALSAGLDEDEVGGSGGCACDASDGAPAAPIALLGLLALVGLRRRRG